MNSGAFGEEWVARYLQKKGWEILERNYHSRYGEIDMIAVDGPYIVFVEVKTRSADSIAGPLEAVTPGKRKRLRRTALDYLQAHELNLQPRFDVAAVVVGQGEPSVEYLVDAFDGGGYELF